MNRTELNTSNITNITGPGKVTKARHGTHNNNIADYVDSSIAIVAPAAIAATLSIPFTNSLSVVETLVLSENVVITPNTTGAVAGNGAMRRIVGNNTNTVTFAGFKTGEADDPLFTSIIGSGEVRFYVFIYDGTHYRVYASLTNDVPLPDPPAPAILDLIFQADQSGITAIGDDDVQGGGAGSYANTGIDEETLIADGIIWSEYQGSETQGVIIGLHNSSTRTTNYSNLFAGVLFANGFANLYKVESGTIAEVSPAEAVVSGTSYGLKREGSTIKIVKSVDRVAITEVATLSVTSGATLYPACVIDGSHKLMNNNLVNL